ncbi:MAG: hypothetical protein BWX61_01019 [Bacteroidetes bacterium ADurb.Bin035]|nr:MAG: hypothetical protein BWX61_01019 [Bacteroidetes bacterium ADurb.Bin035]
MTISGFLDDISLAVKRQVKGFHDLRKLCIFNLYLLKNSSISALSVIFSSFRKIIYGYNLLKPKISTSLPAFCSSIANLFFKAAMPPLNGNARPTIATRCQSLLITFDSLLLQYLVLL